MTSGDESAVAVDGTLASGAPAAVPQPSALAPAARRDRSAPITEPELAEAEAAYARLVAAPYGLTTAPPSPRMAIDKIVDQIRNATRIAREVADAAAPAAAGPLPLLLSALTLQADAYDFLAGHIASAHVPLPPGIAVQALAQTAPTHAQLQAQFEARIRETMASQLGEIYCIAVARYERVLELDPADPRAADQLAAYGEAFVRSCGQ